MRKYRKKSWIDPRIKITSSLLHGKGMFAVAPIKQGEVVVIWALPNTYKTGEEAKRAAAKGIAKGKTIQVFQIDEGLFSVEEKDADPTYFMNHSCDPNVWMKDEVTLIARRDIKPNEELTIDYALMEADEDWVASWECACGSPLCRKRYTGKDWRLSELQDRYHGHFTPLINRRITKSKKQKTLQK